MLLRGWNSTSILVSLLITTFKGGGVLYCSSAVDLLPLTPFRVRLSYVWITPRMGLLAAQGNRANRLQKCANFGRSWKLSIPRFDLPS
jgi:hypothetical protein